MTIPPNDKPTSSRGRTILWGCVLALATLGWVYALVGAEGIGRLQERRERRAQLQGQLAEETKVNNLLRSDVEALRSDPIAIEQAIRDELDFQRPGEQVTIVEDDDPLGRAPRPRVNNVVAPPVPEKMLKGKTSPAAAAAPKPKAAASGAKSKEKATMAPPTARRGATASATGTDGTPVAAATAGTKGASGAQPAGAAATASGKASPGVRQKSSAKAAPAPASRKTPAGATKPKAKPRPAPTPIPTPAPVSR